jgi:hypothetical protein
MLTILPRYVGEISANCNRFIKPELTLALLFIWFDGSSTLFESVGDFTLSKPVENFGGKL